MSCAGKKNDDVLLVCISVNIFMVCLCVKWCFFFFSGLKWYLSEEEVFCVGTSGVLYE